MNEQNQEIKFTKKNKKTQNREMSFLPFSAEIQDDLWVETDRPSNESNPTQNFVRDLQRNRIP